MQIDDDDARRVIAAFDLVLNNLERGASKSIQRLIARENREFVDLLRKALAQAEITDAELPRLPDKTRVVVDWDGNKGLRNYYTDEQMYEYARAAIRASKGEAK